MNMISQIQTLSKREKQIAMKIMEGLPNKIIAADLFISERTANQGLLEIKWTVVKSLYTYLKKDLYMSVKK
jgi:FixJ family two-component response regulator